MVAHSGGPPLAMYLLPLGLSKEIYAGTTSLFFTVGNATKALPRLQLVKPAGNDWTLMATCRIAIPTGVWLGWRLAACLKRRVTAFGTSPTRRHSPLRDAGMHPEGVPLPQIRVISINAQRVHLY